MLSHTLRIIEKLILQSPALQRGEHHGFEDGLRVNDFAFTGNHFQRAGGAVYFAYSAPDTQGLVDVRFPLLLILRIIDGIHARGADRTDIHTFSASRAKTGVNFRNERGRDHAVLISVFGHPA